MAENEAVKATEAQESAELEFNVLDELIEKGPLTTLPDPAKETVKRAVQTLAEQALGEAVTISEDVVTTINSMISEILDCESRSFWQVDDVK